MSDQLISYVPTEADYKVIKKNIAKAKTERKERFRKDHEALMKRSVETQSMAAPFVRSQGLTEDALQKWKAQENKIIFELLKWAPSEDIKNIPWHNPSRTPPYSFPFSDLQCVLATGCSIRGPNPSIGQIGATTVCDAVGLPGTSLANALSSVGTPFVAMSSGTLFIDVSARFFGEGHIGVPFSGYAEAVGGLRVYVERVFPDFEVFQGGLHLFYEHRSLLFEFHRGGLGVHFGGGPGIRMPAEAGAVYHIWVDCVQHATQTLFSAAGIVSDIRVDAISIEIF